MTRILVSLCLITLIATIAYATSVGDFFREGSQLLEMPWGVVTLVDVYAGFALFSGWIVSRERRGWQAACWIVALLLLGNVVSCIYVLAALQGSRGDPARFWMGEAGAARLG